jgi:hypothetical protein
MSDGPEWFAAERFGYGAGIPISWQGWAVVGAYCAIVIAAALLLAPRSQLAFAGVVATATVIFIWIAARTTRGGWRWRWGDKE